MHMTHVLRQIEYGTETLQSNIYLELYTLNDILTLNSQFLPLATIRYEHRTLF